MEFRFLTFRLKCDALSAAEMRCIECIRSMPHKLNGDSGFLEVLLSEPPKGLMPCVLP